MPNTSASVLELRKCWGICRSSKHRTFAPEKVHLAVPMGKSLEARAGIKRTAVIVPVLAFAGSLAAKKIVPPLEWTIPDGRLALRRPPNACRSGGAFTEDNRWSMRIKMPHQCGLFLPMV